MLKKILSRTTCAACQLCCQFDASDIWELPVLPKETVAAIQKYRPETAFVPVGAEQTFAAPSLKGEELCLSSADRARLWLIRAGQAV